MRLAITILGVDHDFQHNDRTGDFRKFVCAQLDKAVFDLVAEEAEETDCTVGQQVALDRSIRWLGMDADQSDRIRLGIHDKLVNRPNRLIFEGDLCVGQRGRYLPDADAVREKLWVSRILAFKPMTALVICGLLHMESLAGRLTTQNCEVLQTNACATEWYKEHYGETMLFLDTDGNLWYEHRYKVPLPIFPR